MSAIGNKITELQKRILVDKNDLSQINKREEPLPEFIDKANLLRSNEYLQRSNEQKSKLIISYEEYVRELEKVVSAVLEIRGNLDSLKSKLKPKRSTTPKKRKKTVKKKRKKTVRKKTRKRPKTRTPRRKLRKKRR